MPGSTTHSVQPRILIVDGDQKQSAGWMQLLEQKGYLVTTADSVEETRRQL